MIELDYSQYNIDRFTVNCYELTVSTAEKSIKLPVKVFELLKLFILNADSSVQRSQAIDVIWDGNEAVGKRAYTNGMWQLRKAFNDLGAENEEVFKTLHKVGYFLVIKPVPFVTEAEAENKILQTTSQKTKVWLNRKVITTLIFSMLMVISGLSYLLLNQEDQYQLITDVSTQKTELLGIEDQPAISNNERYLAFRWLENESQSQSQLYIQDLYDNHNPIRPLTKGKASKSSPVWSPSDDTVAFLLLTKGGECQVRIKHIFTEKTKIVDTGCFYQHQQSGLSWSNDGKFLLYPKFVAGSVQLFRMRLTSNKVSRPAKAKQISFASDGEQDLMGIYSKDNRKLIFVRVKGNKTSLIMSESKGKEHTLVSNLNGVLGIDWHYATGDIYMTIFNNAIYYTQKYNLNDKSMEDIDYIDSSSGLSINHNSNKMYYSRHLNHEFIVQHSLLQDEREISRVKSIDRNYFGRHIPKTSAILFISDRSGEIDLWHKSVRGAKNLTNGMGRVLNSSVSPKSDRFVVSLKADETNQYQLYLGELPRGQLSLLNTGDLVPKNPTWNATADAIYFSSKTKTGSGIFQINIATAEIKQITFDHEIYAVQGDEQMLYTSKEGVDGIWQFNLQSQQSTRIISELKQDDFGNFFWQSNSLYYIFRTTKNDILLNYTRQGTVKVISEFPAGTINKHFGISAADFQSFLFTRNRIFDANIYSTYILTKE